MININKNGNPYHYNLSCIHCNCNFDFQRQDMFFQKTKNNELLYTIQCPCCGRKLGVMQTTNNLTEWLYVENLIHYNFDNGQQKWRNFIKWMN